MEMEKSKVLIQFLVIFRQFGDVLSFLYACRLRGYTATDFFFKIEMDGCSRNVKLIESVPQFCFHTVLVSSMSSEDNVNIFKHYSAASVPRQYCKMAQ